MQSKHQDQPKRTFIEAARRAQIIDSAIEALAELGYVKASLAQIAKRANIATSVVSYYFEGKDDLMREVITEVYSNAANYMQSKIDLNAPARIMLREYIESNLAYGREHSKQLKALGEIIIHWMAEPGKLPTGANPDESILKPLEDLLRWGQETGEFRLFDVHPMAVSIRKAIDGALEQLVTYPDTDMDVYTQELITLFDLATVAHKSD
ncbi:MAG: TetR family transcriptional regulator [Burkholderiales bacterium]|nr:TetR family transcriptional regulator [Anaerolineae bacterium]